MLSRGSTVVGTENEVEKEELVIYKIIFFIFSIYLLIYIFKSALITCYTSTYLDVCWSKIIPF